MRNRASFVWCAAMAATVMTAGSAEGQQRAWDFSLGAGPSFPMSELGDEAKTGYHVQAFAGYRLPMFPAKLRVGVFYQDFDAVEREPSLYSSLGGEWYRQLSAIVDAVVEAPTELGPVRPYGLIGAGWLREWHDDRTYSGKVHAIVSFNLGAGVEFPLMGVNGFLEARYMNLFGGDALETGPPAVYPEVEFKSLPITIGVRM